ncbi:GntR family transcriptional regulator [Dactylosporangium sp. CA-233914]|uniref:GntR family transcriptional regulator n=1 Tax=Dactylosporangium sp. CA-233914 TaxID=3239934 RepID=UPI003D9452A3
MAKRGSSESLVVDVYERLRAEIYDRLLAPGERLRPVELGQRFGVSVGVTRDALGLLAAHGLIKVERNRGFHVVTLSSTALADLTDARKLIEGEALRKSVINGGVAWESEILAAHHRMASEPVYLPDQPSVRNKVWAANHIAFHYKLIEACDNPVLLDICVRLSDAAELYRAWSVIGGETTRDIAGEHQALLDAALAHDADRAVALFEDHVDKTRQLVMELEHHRPGTLEAAS